MEGYRGTCGATRPGRCLKNPIRPGCYGSWQEKDRLTGALLTRIVDISDRLFPFEGSEPWDNCGIQIGDPNRHITSVAVSLDPTLQTIRFASDHHCELLVTHHPVLLHPMRNITADNFAGRILMKAAKSDVNIIALHTNLDAAEGGLNEHLAARLGLERVIVPLPARCARLGELPGPLSVSALARKVAQDLSIPRLRIISDTDREIRKVFCASGSGMGYLQEALRYRADAIVTGDVRYHAAREAMEMGIAVIDAGHYGLEKEAVPILVDSLSGAFARDGLEIACIACDLERDPFEEHFGR